MTWRGAGCGCVALALRGEACLAFMASCAQAVASPAADGASIATVRSLLDGLLRITLADQRILVGKFACFDKQRNVLLSETLEQRFTDGDTVPTPPRAPDFERHLGLVLVPRKHIVAVHAIDPAEYA